MTRSGRNDMHRAVTAVIFIAFIALVSAMPARAGGPDSDNLGAAVDPLARLTIDAESSESAVHDGAAADSSRGEPLPSANLSSCVSLHDGLVSVTARNATLREILEAWARVGDTVIVNADRATTASLTLDLVDVPEEEALALLLRSMSGYLAVPRSDGRADASHFARIVILPTSAAKQGVAVRPASMVPTSPSTPSTPPVSVPNEVVRLIGADGLPVEDDQQQVARRPTPLAFAQSDPSPPVVFPRPGAAAPQQASPASPSAVSGSAVPGMVVPQRPQAQPPPSR
jgi:hypothetical protein